jgi:hypothetical protein
MPRITPGPSGELHLAYVSDEAGTNDIFLRSYVRGKWQKPVAVADTEADEYAPSVVALGKGTALVAYVSNAKGRYDVYTAAVKNGRRTKPKQVTRSPDDAMAPALCRGGKNEIWLSWYQWARMGPLSRDREIFLCRGSGTRWSSPVQVSPSRVPTYEDHADPVVFPDGKGGIWVAWAWDYHNTLPQRPPVDENSIFMRHVDRKMKMGAILAAGFRGEGRARDYAPALAVTPDGVPWVAWDNSHKASKGYSAKAVFVNHLAGDDFQAQVEAAAVTGHIDSPQLLLHPKGRLYLLWCQQSGKTWELCLRSVEQGGLGEVKKLAVTGTTPRYPSGCFDSKGRLWVAYVDVGAKRWSLGVQEFK